MAQLGKVGRNRRSLGGSAACAIAVFLFGILQYRSSENWKRSEFVAAQDGLGYLILISTSQSQTPLAFAAIALLTVLSIVVFYCIEFIERCVVDWTP